MMLEKNVIPFLIALAKNNNKAWFDEHKEAYKAALDDFKLFVDELISQLAITDPLLVGVQAKDCIFRIYRDVRFSNDKTPYKAHFGANIAPGGRKSCHAGFYLHIEPMNISFTGGGIYQPEPNFLKALRNEFYSVPEELLALLNDATFKKYYNGLWQGDKLKTAPKGFPKDFENIDLLKYRSYLVSHDMPLSIISKPDLMWHLVELHKAMYPINRLINTILEDAELL